MDNQQILLITIALFIALLVLFIAFFLSIRNYEKRQNTHFDKVMNDALNKLQNSVYQNTFTSMSEIKSSVNKDLIDFYAKLQNEFNGFNDKTNTNFSKIENNLQTNIKESLKNNNDTIVKIAERIVSMEETQKSLSSLSNDIVALQMILQDKKTRGIFGEIELYSLLENIYGTDTNFWSKQYKLANNTIVDAVIRIGDSDELLAIDSKFPLENYRKMYDETLTKNEREVATKLFRSNIIKHIDDINKKYLNAGQTCPIAFMFVPAEAVFSEIYANFHDVVEYSFKKQVYVVSPTTLMAYITAIKNIYLGQKKNEQAIELLDNLKILATQFEFFKKRNEKVYGDYVKLANDYNELFITSKKLTKQFEKINNMHLENIKEDEENEHQEF